MTLREILDLAYYRVDEEPEIGTDADIQMDTIFTASINQGIGLLAMTKDKKTKVATLPYAEKIKLPTDYFGLVELKHSVYGVMSITDYELIGDLVIPKIEDITSGTFDLTYIFVPVKITDVTATIDLKDIYCIALAAYASYSYTLSQKQYQSATMFLNEFNMIANNGGGKNEA
ncbi:MAG TPA: hypothetical protein VIK72_19195 [Clostridiaceae bacterium]